MRYLSILLLLAACATTSTSTPSSAQSIIGGKTPAPPPKIRDYYAATYLDKPNQKAFAVATEPFPEQEGFALGLSWGHSDPQDAMTAAIVSCEKEKTRYHIDQECRFYAINDTIVWGMSVHEIRAVADSYSWFTTALNEWRPLAEQGMAEAQHKLGIMYTNGEGVAQDYAEAVKWYRLAAEQGYDHAQYNLGIRYDEGQGVTQDYVQAHMWFNLAASRQPRGENRDLAVSNRDIVEAKMTPAQVAEAQRLAREWKPK